MEQVTETAPRIEFDGLERPEKVREDVAGYVAGLENRFGRITACHVVVRSPGEHHRSGGLYEVNIRLAQLDGRAQRLRKLGRVLINPHEIVPWCY